MKRAANVRQIEPPRRVDYHQRFLKNWRRLLHAGIYDLYRMKQVMLLLIYQVSERSISFILAGSHAQLLEM